MFQNQKLDLRVTVTGGDYTDIADVWADRGKDPDEKNGKGGDGKFGNINLQTVEGKPKSGEGDFTFCIVREGTDDPVALEQFSWTIFDLDERGSDNGSNGIGIKEKFIMDVSQAEVFQVIDGTEVVISCEDGKTDLPCDPGVRTVFHSSTSGVGKDNPEDPNNLTFKQRARSVAFTFQDTSCWDITYDHYCPPEQPGYTETNDRRCRNYTGGNFLFSGSSEQMIEEGECRTLTPTVSPTVTPTTAVTTSAPTSGGTTSEPTAMTTFVTSSTTTTDATTSSPTAAPDLTPPLPPSCPEDVKLLKIDGVTEIDLGNAIRIVEQDTTSVTVRLHQAWTASPTDTVDHIFYQYEEGLWKSDCEEETDVGGGMSYTPPEDITIRCMYEKPYATMKICLADTGGGFLQPGLDAATVPKCCHPGFDDSDGVVVPAVCYKVLIECESQCIDTVERRGRGLRGAFL